jgi:hypothetical protein
VAIATGSLVATMRAAPALAPDASKSLARRRFQMGFDFEENVHA